MMCVKLFFLIYSLVMYVPCLGEKSMIVKRSGFEDQAVSASGYAYQADGNGPISYSSYRIGSGNLQQLPLGYLGTPRIVQHHQLGLPPSPLPTFRGNLVKPSDSLPANSQQGLFKFQPWMPLEYSLPYLNNYHNYYGLGGNNYNYEKGNAENNEQEKNSVNAIKGESGQQNRQSYDNKAEGKHLKEGHKEAHSKQGGNIANNHNSANYHSKNSEAQKGVKGGSFGESSGHRKGSKTTGYHKVYHKDEYKKDHSFYDESDSSGHHDEFEKKNSQFGKENGASVEGGRSNGGHQESDYGTRGFQDRGKYLDEDKGHQGQQADSAYYKNNENFAKKGGRNYQDENGYAVSDDSD